MRLDAVELRQLFIDKLWTKELYPAITNALVRARGELDAQPISVVLLSGGSSNIRWLQRLIRESNIRDFENAELLELQENFQEIVAKGLAIECARKTFNKGDGDFRAVTYNRLCLGLNSDERGFEIQKHRAVTKGLPVNMSDGILLPSASMLEAFIDKPISWKVKLSHPPKRQLDYFFMASSFDPEDTENVHNIVDHTIRTPDKATFDSSLLVELLVRKDGTTTPKFIYRSAGPNVPEVAKVGRPFYMDMTFGGASGTAEAYFGLDFGTSNSSISYVDQSAITVYADRARSSAWQNISDLATVLPYPIARPLASYLSAANESSIDLKAIEAIEGFLMFGAYVAYAEHCSLKGRAETKLFKEFSQRSAGPLWALLRKSLEQMKGKEEFSKPLRQLFDSPIFEELDPLITAIGAVKHGKAEVPPDYQRAIRLLGNVYSDYCSQYLLGYFQDVQKKPFRSIYYGIFRHTAGGHGPFVSLYDYEGTSPFSEDQVLLLSRDTGKVLSLGPMMFWYRSRDAYSLGEPELYCFDLYDKGVYSYKMIGAKGGINLDESNFEPLLAELKEMKSADPLRQAVEGLTITPASE